MAIRQCEVCGLPHGLHYVQLLWQNEAPTTHELCDSCWRGMRWRRPMAGLMQVVGGIATFFTGIAAATLIAAYFVSDVKRSEREQIAMAALAATVVTLVSLTAALRAAHVRVPAPLRNGHRPKHFLKAQFLGDTPGEAARTVAQIAADVEAYEQAIINSIESGESVYRLARLCGGLPSAITTFAAYQSQKFKAPSERTVCCTCNSARELRLVEWTWISPPGGDRTNLSSISILLLLVGHIHFTTHKAIRFQTYHVFCQRCMRAAWKKHATTKSVYVPFAAIMLLIGFIVALCGLSVGLMEKNSSISNQAFIGGAVGIAVLAAAIWLNIVVRRKRVPPPLKTLDRTPFKAEKMRKIADLPDAI
jgi:hypothetical protein